MRRTGTGRCCTYLVWADATPDGPNTLISAYWYLYDDDYYSYDKRDKALTPHWLDKVVGDLILRGPTVPTQAFIMHWIEWSATGE